MHRYILLAALATAMPSLRAATFISLDMPGSQLSALSHNGCIAVGGVLGGNPAGFRWSAETGTAALKEAIAVHGLSASGAFVAGSTLDAMQREVAVYWDASGAIHRIPPMRDLESVGAISQAHAISDEPRVVGSAHRRGGGQFAFEWTAATGMHALAPDDREVETHALSISDDGRRIAGWERRGDRVRPLRWRDGRLVGAVADIAAVPGEILGGSQDAEILVGWLGVRESGAAAVYRGTDIRRLPAESGVVRLLAGSNDGKVLVGDSGSGDNRTAWIWLESEGFVSLADLLASRHVSLPSDWRPLALTATSADGKRLAGWGKHGGNRLDSFIVDLGNEDGCGSAAPLSRRVPAP